MGLIWGHLGPKWPIWGQFQGSRPLDWVPFGRALRCRRQVRATRMPQNAGYGAPRAARAGAECSGRPIREPQIGLGTPARGPELAQSTRIPCPESARASLRSGQPLRVYTKYAHTVMPQDAGSGAAHLCTTQCKMARWRQRDAISQASSGVGTPNPEIQDLEIGP